MGKGKTKITPMDKY